MDLTPVFEALIVGIAGLIGVAMYQVAQRLRAWLEAKQITDQALVAVRYVEQLAADGQLKKIGWAKTEEAVDFLIRELAARGVTINRDRAIPLILGALRELKDSFGEQWANKEKADDSGAAEVTE